MDPPVYTDTLFTFVSTVTLFVMVIFFPWPPRFISTVVMFTLITTVNYVILATIGSFFTIITTLTHASRQSDGRTNGRTDVASPVRNHFMHSLQRRHDHEHKLKSHCYLGPLQFTRELQVYDHVRTESISD
jgi:hypothetical protein